MTPGSGRFLRDNAFLVAAVSLPLVVVAFFLLSTAIPRWTVPPPAYDLLLRANDVYNSNQINPRVTEFSVRDGKVEAKIRAIPANAYLSRTALFLFDHATFTVSEIPVELPDKLVLVEGDPPRTIVVDTPPGRPVLAQARAPDGYQLETRSQRGPGIVGELFGMHRYNSDSVLTNRGRVVQVTLPGPYQNQYVSSVSAVGWLVPESGNGQR
jgi:hypothetical protein